MTSVDVDASRGLTASQVAERVASGQVNAVKDRNARSLGDIARANTFTYFNALIGSLWILMLVSAPLIDGLFGLVIVVNTLIGVVQEYRAARTLAKLSLVHQQQALVRRDGAEVEIRPNEVVLDDLLLLRTGDQMIVDAEVIESSGLELDESLLTGEADPVEKGVGAEVLSGSFVVAGSGLVRAARVGHDSYAAKLADEASKFSLTRSELRDSIQKFIRYVSYALVPVAILLFISQYRANDGNIRSAIAGTVPGVITMVPEGLVLLTSVAMAVSVIRLAQRKALVQDMPAVEVLARVDVVCVDKTGTLTEPGMAVRWVLSARASPIPTPRSWPSPTSTPHPGDGRRSPPSPSRAPASGRRRPSRRTAPGCSALPRSCSWRATPCAIRPMASPPAGRASCCWRVPNGNPTSSQASVLCTPRPSSSSIRPCVPMLLRRCGTSSTRACA